MVHVSCGAIARHPPPISHDGSFIGRYATYTGAGFQEGVSLSCVDEVIRLRKYAYGACEMLLNKFKVSRRLGVGSGYRVRLVVRLWRYSRFPGVRDVKCAVCFGDGIGVGVGERGPHPEGILVARRVRGVPLNMHVPRFVLRCGFVHASQGSVCLTNT